MPKYLRRVAGSNRSRSDSPSALSCNYNPGSWIGLSVRRQVCGGAADVIIAAHNDWAPEKPCLRGLLLERHDPA